MLKTAKFAESSEKLLVPLFLLLLAAGVVIGHKMAFMRVTTTRSRVLCLDINKTKVPKITNERKGDH